MSKLSLEEAINMFKTGYSSSHYTVLEAADKRQSDFWNNQKVRSDHKKLKFKMNDSEEVFDSTVIASIKLRNKNENDRKEKKNAEFNDAIAVGTQYYNNRKSAYSNAVVMNNDAQVAHYHQTQALIIPSKRTLLVKELLKTRNVFNSPPIFEMKRKMNKSNVVGQIQHLLTESEQVELTRNHSNRLIRKSTNLKLATDDNTAEGAVARKAKSYKKLSATHLNNDQQNPKEGNAIRLFVEFIQTTDPGNGWDFKYPFDFLQADLMVRNKTWKDNEYIMVQVKSVSIKFGLMAKYYEGNESRRGLYDSFIY